MIVEMRAPARTRPPRSHAAGGDQSAAGLVREASREIIAAERPVEQHRHTRLAGPVSPVPGPESIAISSELLGRDRPQAQLDTLPVTGVEG
ncbi:hypothetical protein ACIBPB_12385 [Micromonospora sp. NPDC049836]|uniref:hypothetical protein n=1 Tax=Micromonospora sp. NPDC049836 TaxID=3364274 RepID=UPI0037BC04CD